MNLKRLRTFVQVVDKRSFSEVADIQNITQSGVSRQIKTLEKEVSIQLLNRNTALVELTPAGRYVYKKSKALLEQWDQLVQECQGMKDELTGRLRIGTSTIPATYLIPRILKNCQEKYPRVEFCMKTGDSSEILNQLENQTIDVALVGMNPGSPELESTLIAEDRLVLIGNDPDLTMSSAEEIQTQPMILREKGSGTRVAMDRALSSHGVDLDHLNCAIEVSSTDAVLAMVEAGVGISFVSHLALKENGRNNVYPLYEIPTDRGFYLTAHQKRRYHPLVQTFVEETLNIY